jgi:hypothetical protein
MGMTLLEAAKLMVANGQLSESVIVEMVAMSNPLLQFISFNGIPGMTYSYTVEAGLPEVAFRGINESFTASTGVLNPQSETLLPAGGEIEIDSYILRRGGARNASAQLRLKLKALNQLFLLKFFKGDSESNVKEWDGLQKRLVGEQVFTPAENGGALSLAQLDELISRVAEPTHLAMSKALATKFGAAARDTAIGGYITTSVDQFGRRVISYAGLPIMEIEDALGGNTILPFSETCGNSSVTTSLYCLSLRDGMISGLQGSEGMTISQIGAAQNANKPANLTRIEWDIAIAVEHGRAAARYKGITNAAIVK